MNRIIALLYLLQILRLEVSDNLRLDVTDNLRLEVTYNLRLEVTYNLRLEATYNLRLEVTYNLRLVNQKSLVRHYKAILRTCRITLAVKKAPSTSIVIECLENRLNV